MGKHYSIGNFFLYDRKRVAITVFLLLLFYPVHIFSQTGQKDRAKFKVSGRIYELNGKKRDAISYATVSFTDYAITALSNNDGNYSLNDIPAGKAQLRIHYIGKVEIDTLINVNKDIHLDFILQDNNFRLKEVVVTAEESKASKATSSTISRMAMDHLQATSLQNILSLMPGGISGNQDLNDATQINIRSISSNTVDENLNGLGSAVIRNGAPISNNANLEALNPTVTGGAIASLSGGASPAGGIDTRSISVENIESVEVIRGIPSVEYGDLSSGAVIINSKAGKEPLRVNTKVNPNVYEFSANRGLELGGDKGALNVGLDYAYNVKDPIESYRYYQRAAGNVLYSNYYFNNRLKNNISLDFSYGHDKRNKNPDDQVDKISSDGKDIGFILNTNGSLYFKDLWLKNIRYVASFSYTSKKSYYEAQYSTANAPYSMTTTDGAVLSNTAGAHVYDAAGTEITNFGTGDAGYYANYLPSTYVARYDIDGKEINFFSKVSANFFKKLGNTNHRFIFGADFKTDGNKGNGKTFDPTNPPYRNLSALNATYRTRSYKDIPFINQLGIFAEENLKWNIGNRSLNIQAGLRYDHVSVVKSVLSPRINASLDIIPKYFAIRGGYGITAKMPTALYLHPEPAYFEYININELANESIAENERLFITTTKVFDSSNKDLQVAKNHKAEVGFDLRIKQARLAVTAFSEKMNNGYSLSQTVNSFKPVTFNEYTRNSSGGLVLSESNHVLASFSTPNNNRVLNTKGLEFDLNLGRFEPIRTSVSFNGGWFRSESYTNDYAYYDESGTGGSSRKDVALYQSGVTKHYNERLSTALRITHNIPNIGFVITLTAQAIWKEADWYKMGNDSIPVGYISKTDGSTNLFTPGQYTTREQLQQAGKDYLLATVNTSNYIKESYPALFCFNINITKEIGKYMRASFFANNLFRSYPVVNSKRNPGSKVVRNMGSNDFFFGCELSFIL